MQVLTNTKLYTTMMKTIIADILAGNIHDAGIKASCIKICKTVKELCQCVIDLRIPKSTMYCTFILIRYPKVSSQFGFLDPFDNTIKVCFLISPYKKTAALDSKFSCCWAKTNVRENGRGNQEQKIQRKLKGQSRIDNPEKTEGAIKNRQSRENRRGNQEQTIQRNIGYTRRRQTKQKTQHRKHKNYEEHRPH